MTTRLLLLLSLCLLCLGKTQGSELPDSLRVGMEAIEDQNERVRYLARIAKEHFRDNTEFSVHLADHAMTYTLELEGLELGRGMLTMSDLYFTIGLFEKSYLAIYRGIAVTDSMGDKITKSRLLLNKGLLDSKMEHYDEAIEAGLQAIDIMNAEGDSLPMVMTSINMGVFYLFKEDFEEAAVWSSKAMALAEKGNDTHSKSYAQGNLALALLGLEQYEEAETVALEAIATFEEFELDNDVAIALNTLGRIEQAKGNFDQARSHLERALALGRDVKVESTELESQEILAELYAEMGLFELALAAQKEVSRLETNESKFRQNEQLNVLAVQYKTELKAQEANEANLKLAKVEQDAALKNYRYTLIIGGLGVVLMVGAFFFFRLRQNLRNKKAMIAKTKELHDMQRQLIESELRNKELESKTLKSQLDSKAQDLTDFALDIARKNEFEAKVCDRLEAIKKKVDDTTLITELQEMLFYIRNHLKLNEELGILQSRIDDVNTEYSNRLVAAYPNLTSNEIQLCGLIRLNLSSKKIAAIKNISPKSVEMSRYRLRKKLNLDTEQDLVSFLRVQ